MTEQTAKATITTENTMIPIAYDGACSSVPVSEMTVVAALKEFEWKNGYVGFQFAKAVLVKVQPDDGSEEFSVRAREADKTIYTFAKKVISIADFNTAAEYAQARSTFSPDVLADLETGGTIYTKESGALGVIRSPDQRTVLINKQGDKLWPLPKA